METFKTFANLCLEAKDACDNLESTQDFEIYLLRVLNFIKSNISHKKEFQEHFVQMLNDSNLGPWELIVFCMRELQWKEVLEAALRRIKDAHDFRIKNVMAEIVAVYQKDWEDADMYEYYTKSRHGSVADSSGG